MKTFGGFAFDEEVLSDFMQEQPAFKNEILSSAAVVEDSTIMDLIGEKGNTATIPFYKPLTLADYTPENYDGETNQSPKALSGGAQTCVLIGRMQSWAAKSFTKELTGADPIGDVGVKVNNYYQQIWEDLLLLYGYTLMGVAGLESHITSIASAGPAPAAGNLHDAETLINAKQTALGDMAYAEPGLIFMHSKVYANYLKQKLVDFDRYTVQNALGQKIALPSINGDIVMQRDIGTAFTLNAQAAYRTFLFGPGAFLTAPKSNIEKPFYLDYDAETAGGTDLLYTKMARVLHPNGVSFDSSAMAKASPTRAELATVGNWSLKFDHKNVKIGLIVSNG
jgi:hypothetical protein